MNLTPCGDFMASEADTTSKLCVLGIQTSQPHTSIHMFGPHASNGGCPLARTHAVIGEMLPSVWPLGPSL